jgi:hypothetical protein
MTRYLNYDERVGIISLLSLQGQLEHYIEKWDKVKDKDTLKRFRTARTNIEKGVDNLLTGVSEESLVKLHTVLKTMHFSLTSKPVKDPQAYYAIKSVDIAQDISECILEVHCKECDGTKKDCTYRKLMESWDVPPDPDRLITNYCEYARKEVDLNGRPDNIQRCIKKAEKKSDPKGKR